VRIEPEVVADIDDVPGDLARLACALIVALDESSLSTNVTPVNAAYGSSQPLRCASW
jgi:hypothetical protein